MTRLKMIPFAAAAVALVAMGADTPMQTIKTKGITFDIPKAWTSSKPSSTMRIAQYKVDPTEGDKDPAELALFAFGGGAGGVDANVARWKAQFQDADGKPPKIVTEKRKGKNVEVTFVETSGRYVAAVSEKFDKPDWMLMGAIVQSGGTDYFLKMVGPKKTMKAAKTDFEAMMKTIAVEEK